MFIRLHGYVGDPKPGFETQPFIECVHAGIGSTALHQHVVAVRRPRMSQCGSNHSLAMTLSPQLRVGNDVFEEAVASSSAKQVRCDNEHTGRSDTIMIIGHEDADSRLR